MTAMTLFNVAAEYREAAEKLYALDLPEEVVRDTLESLAGDVETKARAVGYVIRNVQALSASIKEAEAELAARRKAFEARAERISAYLLNCMQLAGVPKVEAPHFTLAVRQNPPSVVIDEPGLLPEGYWRQKPPPAPEPDKTAIAAALKEGRDVPGAHLTRTTRIDIR